MTTFHAMAMILLLAPAESYYAAARGYNCHTNQRPNENSCKEAASHFDCPYAGAVSSSDRPAACFWDKDGDVHYNSNMNGHTTWGGVVAICNDHADSHHFHVGAGATNCDSDNRIDAELRCRTVAEALHYHYSGSVSQSDRPVGCFYDHGDCYLNTNIHGNPTWGGVSPICEGPATTTTTTHPPSPPPDPTPSPSSLLGHCNSIHSTVWPVFNDRKELQASHSWASYFTKVYGAVPASGYPICVAGLSHLYKPHLTAAGVSLPALSDDCPSAAGDFYSTMTDHQDDFSVWIWNPALAQPEASGSLLSDTWVEFIHQKYSMDKDATWMYYTPGTAIWFYLGKTQAYDDHDNAVTTLLKEPCQGGGGWGANDHECIPQFPRLYAAARQHGLKSLQFRNHADMPCGKHHIRKNMAVEIVDLGGPGTTTCGSNRYRAGWEAQHSCSCDQSQHTVNCQGFGIRGSGRSVELV